MSRKPKAKGKVDIEKIQIHPPAPTTEYQDYEVVYSTEHCNSLDLSFAVEGLFWHLGIADARAYIEAQPESDNKGILLAALGKEV